MVRSNDDDDVVVAFRSLIFELWSWLIFDLSGLSLGKKMGFDGVLVRAIGADSIAEKEGRLRVGDRIIAVRIFFYAKTRKNKTICDFRSFVFSEMIWRNQMILLWRSYIWTVKRTPFPTRGSLQQRLFVDKFHLF